MAEVVAAAPEAVAAPEAEREAWGEGPEAEREAVAAGRQGEASDLPVPRQAL